jgi:hypothetical protein
MSVICQKTRHRWSLPLLNFCGTSSVHLRPPSKRRLRSRNRALLRSQVLRRIGTTSRMASTTTGRNATMYQQGDIVLIPFPFTDLTAMKTRPAVVVSREYDTGGFGQSIPRRLISMSCSSKLWNSAGAQHPSRRNPLRDGAPRLLRYPQTAQPGAGGSSAKLGRQTIRPSASECAH